MADTDLYDRHPINAEQILETIAAEGKSADGLSPADLRPHDQDHYGGVQAVKDLAEAAGVGPGDVVADICAGMAGPARLIAECYDAGLVIGLDYNWGRCKGGAQLNRLVGLGGRVRMVRCDAQYLPLAENVLDAAVSQEALLHIPDKSRVLTGVLHGLKPGARFAFTDLVALDGLTDGDRRRLAENGMQMVNLPDPVAYRAMAQSSGFHIAAEHDLSVQWRDILIGRMEMYRQMEQATERVHGAEAHRQYMDAYGHFVGLVRQGALGGLRMVLEKPGN